jgi:hypothetical protein
LNLAIDEDQSNDTERRHTTEQVAYFIIDPPLFESSASNDVVSPSSQMTSRKQDSTTDPRLRDVMTVLDSTSQLRNSSKLVSHDAQHSRPPLSRIKAVDAALADDDNDWSVSNISDTLIGSMALGLGSRVR